MSFIRSGQYVVDFRAQHPVLYTVSFFGPALAAASGMFMLLGFGWARWLLVGWFAITALGFLLYSPLRLVLPGALFIVSLVFLFRPPATEYFRRTTQQPVQRDENVG
jgi:hypothetical protein